MTRNSKVTSVKIRIKRELWKAVKFLLAIRWGLWTRKRTLSRRVSLEENSYAEYFDIRLATSVYHTLFVHFYFELATFNNFYSSYEISSRNWSNLYVMSFWNDDIFKLTLYNVHIQPKKCVLRWSDRATWKRCWRTRGGVKSGKKTVEEGPTLTHTRICINVPWKKSRYKSVAPRMYTRCPSEWSLRFEWFQRGFVRAIVRGQGHKFTRKFL